jgi:hypothetical protein
MTTQAAFAAALLNPQASCPPGLVSWNGSDPAQRFAVYRNNVLASRVGALADTFPVVQRMVGEVFFRAMAAGYVHAVPPTSPVLVNYGADFAQYIAGFAPASGLPYLADLARLEWSYVQSFHAADADALPLSALTALLADETQLARVCFRLQPSLYLLQSAYAVHSLWAAHQGAEAETALRSINPYQPESVLLLRQGLSVEVLRLEQGAGVFIEQLVCGLTFAAAVNAAPAFDLATALGWLLRGGAITHFHVQEL